MKEDERYDPYVDDKSYKREVLDEFEGRELDGFHLWC